MNPTAQLFYDIGEPFAAGFVEIENASLARKYCRAYRRFYESCTTEVSMPDKPVYPSGYIMHKNVAVTPTYCLMCAFNKPLMESKSQEAAKIFDDICTQHNVLVQTDGKLEVLQYAAYIDGWNHSALNYKRINEEGLDKYEERVLNMKDEDMREALLDVLIGLRNYHSRCVAYLESINADQKLIDALKKVPFKPAETAYEALVSANFMLYLDYYDDFGYVDSWLPKYWKGEDLTDVIHCMMKNLELFGGWSVAIGPEYSDLTKQWINASEGCARPMVELRTTPDMPDDIWETALNRVLSGGGQPSFYNERVIQARLQERFPHAPKEDIYQFSGMGCTETSLSGLTYCGGIDVNLNVLRVFNDCMREELSAHSDFDSFYEAFFKRVHIAQDTLMEFIDRYYLKRAELIFNPIRTLFTDDCIDNEKGFFQGGARYTYSITSDSGIPNTADSLLAVKELVFDKKLYSAEEFISLLDAQDPRFLAQLKSCPCYGTGNAEADSLINDLTKRFYSYYKTGKLTLGLGFLPTSHQFSRHVVEGQRVGFTPDGRNAYQPVADSIAALNGKAQKGPTVMLHSASHYAQENIYGIPVLNISISPKFDPQALRSLIEGYFDMDGTQIQITCTSVETLLDAQKNPDAHRDLIVRIGGYSDYFNKLPRNLQDAVIARTMFEA